MSDADNEEADRRAREERMFQHGIHVDTMLFQRGNLFLVAQSLMAVAYATVQSEDARHIMAGFGIVLTLCWIYVSHRHYRYTIRVLRRLEEQVPDYRATRAATRLPGFNSTPVIAYAIPTLSGVMWLALLAL